MFNMKTRVETRRVFFLLASISLFGSVSCIVREPEQTAPAARSFPLAASPVVLAQHYVEARRRKDREWLRRLVHPASLQAYQARQAQGGQSYEEIWRQGDVPRGRVETSVTLFVAEKRMAHGHVSQRLGNISFIYPVQPSHTLQIHVRSVEGPEMVIANHPVRAEEGRWYIVLPIRMTIMHE